jgi:hypothetical protein
MIAAGSSAPKTALEQTFSPTSAMDNLLYHRARQRPSVNHAEQHQAPGAAGIDCSRASRLDLDL